MEYETTTQVFTDAFAFTFDKTSDILNEILKWFQLWILLRDHIKWPLFILVGHTWLLSN